MSTVVALAMDHAAIELYWDACDALESVDHLIDAIPDNTVTGPETREELAQAAELLRQVSAILERTAARECPRYELLKRAHEVIRTQAERAAAGARDAPRE